MRKGFAPIFMLVGVLIIVVITAGVYYFGRTSVTFPTTNTSNPSANFNQKENYSNQVDTSNWMTYTNQFGKFSFKVPQDWTVKPEFYIDEEKLNFEQELLSGDYKYKDQDFNLPIILNGSMITVAVFKNQAFRSLEDITDLYRYEHDYEREIYLGGVKAVFTKQKTDEYTAYTLKDGVYYIIVFRGAMKDTQEFETILSTFQFSQ